MYNYGMETGFGQADASSFSTGGMIWLIVSLILSFIGCFIVYFLFVEKKDNPKQSFLAWLKDFLSFNKMLIESILKIAYIFVALLITLGSFALIGTSFLLFLSTLVFGNITARVIFEGILIKIMIWKNTTEIKKKLAK